MVYLLCGLIGSGKSTWARNTVKNSKAVIVCRDSLREMIAGEYKYDLDTEPLVKGLSKGAVELAMVAGYDVIIDETNINKKKRAFWLDDLEADDVAIVWFTSAEGNVDRRMADDARGYSREKWQEVFDGMAASFEDPEVDEGVKEVIRVKI